MAFLRITLIFAVLMAALVVQEASAQDVIDLKPHLYRRSVSGKPPLAKGVSSSNVKPPPPPPPVAKGPSLSNVNPNVAQPAQPVVNSAAPPSQINNAAPTANNQKQPTSWKKTKIAAAGVAAVAVGSALLNDGPDYGPYGPVAPPMMAPMPMAPMMAPMPGYYY